MGVAPEILAVTVSPHVQSPRIDYYRGEGNPIEHIQRHEASLLGRTNDDNPFALFFPATLGGVTSHWFFGLSKASVRSWGDLKDKFIWEHDKASIPWTTLSKGMTKAWATSIPDSTKN